MRATICVGDYADTPYFVAGLEVPVYCMEELCYCIKENAFLLDTGIMNDGLVDWIGSKCGLKELAKRLHPLVHRQGSLSMFVSMIMEYTGLYDNAVIRNVEQVLKKGAGLSSIEKRKSQIDYLVGRKKYVSAMKGYDALLSKWEEMEQAGKNLPASSVLAAIWHNKGVAYAGMMNYSKAGDCFYKAYELEHSAEYYQTFLAAKRLELSEDEYIAFVADRPEGCESILELEKTLEQARKNWEEQADFLRMSERGKLRFGPEKQRYYDENERLTEALKESYREYVE